MSTTTYFATYTFPSSTALQGTCVRGYATGRYLNNSVVQPGNINFAVNLNQNSLFNCLATPLPISTVAMGWFCWLHLYFSSAVTDAGAACSAGANIHAGVTNAFTNGVGAVQETGNSLTHFFSMLTNPYLTPVPNGQSTAVIFGAVIPTGDVLEVHHAYLEGL